MSLPSLVSDTAMTFSMPDSSTNASCAPMPSNLFGLGVNGRPVSAAMRSQNTRSKSGCRLSPVPTAVPPCGRRQQARHRGTQPLDAELHLARPGAELLAERHRHRVHHMGAADLHDRRPFAWRARASAARSVSRAGISACMASTAAMCITVGKLSLEDWPRLT